MIRWLKPFAVLVAALAAGTLLLGPMVGMNPRDLPIAIVNLDEGVVVQGNLVEAGHAAAQQLLDRDTDGMVAWQQLESQEALDDALANNELYAALVIPSTFSQSQVAAMMGSGTVDSLTLIINEGKNPMVTAQLASSVVSLIGESDITITTEAYNELPDAIGQLATILPMALMILAYISSYAGGIAIRGAVPLGESGRGKTIATQLSLAVVAALVTGFSAAGITAAFAPSLELSILDAALFIAIAAFALMTLVIGSINWVGIVGMIVPIGILLLGLGTANLPFEFLPAYWQDWVYPWNPLRFLAEGARAVLYQGAGWWNAATLGLFVIGVVGVALAATSMLARRPSANPSDNGWPRPGDWPSLTGEGQSLLGGYGVPRLGV